MLLSTNYHSYWMHVLWSIIIFQLHVDSKEKWDLFFVHILKNNGNSKKKNAWDLNWKIQKYKMTVHGHINSHPCYDDWHNSMTSPLHKIHSLTEN